LKKKHFGMSKREKKVKVKKVKESKKIELEKIQ
jgi:hypothetical protein